MGEYDEYQDDNPVKGLFIHFKYTRNKVKYEFRWQGSDWIDMYEGNTKLWDKGVRLEQEGNPDGEKYKWLHSHYKTEIPWARYIDGMNEEIPCIFTDSDSLVKELDRCIEVYESIKKIDT